MHNYRQTALYIVARENGKETAEFLISHGVNINEKDNDGNTALHYAALRVHLPLSDMFQQYQYIFIVNAKKYNSNIRY
ncbi:hypothetical protein TVAG_260810 [Trichomonas vaginalis G3]|uniref:Uncharacterized protein n=1 Tax=Trichomonas vaginalis (strain ATCC PRA-98 / G3) TaxID=412133 RepID=A2EXK4_TRIV3|nr:hypothetical protein TVAG_260810 [Trichomonas vaginalis G3]|eukprot:XP_001314844.1 hypothetical protein [Trichomonas vaginalis G3]